MTMAVAGARFTAVAAASAHSTFSRNGAAVAMGAPLTSSSSVSSCVFSEFFLKSRSVMNAAIVARASDLEQGLFGELTTEDIQAAREEAARTAPPEQEVQQGSKLYVGNLPWTCDSAQLAEICQDHGTVEAVEVIYDQESGRSRGFAFVTMASTEDAQKLIDALDGSDLGGRALRVNFPQPKGDRPRFQGSERRTFNRREDNPNKLFVGNLTWGCNESDLHQLFSDFGKVVEARIVTDRETGRSKGFGFVTLENASQVNNAIENLDGADFEGRQLRVNLAGDKPPPRQF